MARFANAVLFTPVAGGTVDFVVSAAVQGYMTPALAGAPTGVYKYRAESADLSEWEIGEGTYTSGTTTITRTTVLYNSAGTGSGAGQSGAGSKINFTVAPNVSIGLQTIEDTLGIDQTNVWNANQKAQGRANLDVLKFNYIINGAMMISQQNGITAGTASNYYPADQFFVEHSTAGVLSVAQVASVTPAGSPNRIRATVTTADASVGATDYAILLTRIEGYRVADLRAGTAAAKTITIQFGVKAPAGTYSVSIRNGTFARAYSAEFVISGGEANTDVVKSVTIALDQSGTWDKTNGIGFDISWGLMAGTTYQHAPNTWANISAAPIASSNQFNFMGAISNVFELFDVSLTEGTAAPAFRVPDYFSELALCQRYFVPLYQGAMFGGGTVRTGGTSFYGSVTSPVEMRAAPTIGTSGLKVIAGDTITAVSTCPTALLSANTIRTLPTTGATTGAQFDAWIFYQQTGDNSLNARM